MQETDHMPKEIDRWLLDANGDPDPFAQTIDFSSRTDDLLDDEPTPALRPQVIRSVAQPLELEDDEPIEPVIAPDPEEPEVANFEGGQAVLEKDKGQWKLTITNEAGGNPQVYWGRNKNELLLSGLAKAQFNATKKIREQNLALKLNRPAPVKPPEPVTPASKNLTADEIFEIGEQLKSNPDLALNAWFQKSTGMSVQRLTELAQKGAAAEYKLQAEAVCREFLLRNPDFYPSDENSFRLFKWIGKFKLGIDTDNSEVLTANGVFDVANLEEAFRDLSEDNLLTRAPRQAPPAPAPPVQDNAQPSSRIVNTVVRPRAATGLRPGDVTQVAPPAAPQAPSVEDFENMDDATIAKLLRQSIAHASRSTNRRS
jgi:hypothetical protein